MRLLAAAVMGVATAVAAAVVLGDYPLTGSVPWFAAVVIPLLIGGVMTFVSDRQQGYLWMATGPLAVISLGWGVRIATGWGLDPVPASCWAAGAVALVWPLAWGIHLSQRSHRRSAAVDPVGGPDAAPPPAAPAPESPTGS